MFLKEKVQALPLSPGVYLMKDANGSVIYVGKAKNLKRRVQSYFQNSQAHSKKVEKLRQNIKDFDVILTDTEFEAFMLECRLIHEIKPFFNRQMKNPQLYAFINVHMEDNYPRIEVSNGPCANKDCLRFGPFKNRNTVEMAVVGLKEFCKILCSSSSKTHSPCLNYSLGLCMGICLGDSAAGQYKMMINKIIALLTGEDLEILEGMKQKMLHAAENFEFETAAKYRNFLEAIHSLLYKEKVIEFTEENKTIVMVEFLTDRSFKLFLIKRSKILFGQKYELGNVEELIPTIKVHLKDRLTADDPSLPNTVSKEEIDEAQIIYSYLESGKCIYREISEKWLVSEETVLEDVLRELLR
ncbi:GIY-YIG nuclease family protein [Neobacillus mesonae]|uniref:GIY-YIG nuclease family protein n=1 Tax=Neobacillus mesonae TaxID=1193713 RepID=UPI0008342D1E|nr:GIY-YIG nuclease family protein [Neobacillus mesonae]